MFLRLAAALFCLLAGCNAVTAQNKYALVIGNKNYSPVLGMLHNPQNDANLVAAALNDIGFEVTELLDADRAKILVEVSKLADKLSQQGSRAVGFFYYSGHGVSRPAFRTNYLVPVDITNMNDSYIWPKLVAVDEIVSELEKTAPDAAHFLVFDACRNELRTDTKGPTKGWAPITASNGFFIATSTGPNTSSMDDPDQSSGPYARALAIQLRNPGLDHLSLFQNVKETVAATTNPPQYPTETNDLRRRIYLNPAPPVPRVTAPPAPSVALNAPDPVAKLPAITSPPVAPFKPSPMPTKPLAALPPRVTETKPPIADGFAGKPETFCADIKALAAIAAADANGLTQRDYTLAGFKKCEVRVLSKDSSVLACDALTKLPTDEAKKQRFDALVHDTGNCVPQWQVVEGGYTEPFSDIVTFNTKGAYIEINHSKNGCCNPTLFVGRGHSPEQFNSPSSYRKFIWNE